MDYAFQGRHPFAQLAAMVAHNFVQPEDSTWYTDSGANHHLTHAMENPLLLAMAHICKSPTLAL
jgi:hypothetical protein